MKKTYSKNLSSRDSLQKLNTMERQIIFSSEEEYFAHNGFPKTNEQLQRFTEYVSLKWFGRPFRHCAYYNARLKTTGGRYHTKTGNIDLNPKTLEYLPTIDFIGIIKHELCHYHLHQEQRGYKHRDDEFKRLLQQVGGLRYVKWPEQAITRALQYQCQRCQQLFARSRKINTKKYVCGRCKGPLQLIYCK